MSAVIGGTAEALGGGKFANGAVTGAYVMMFNHLENRRNEGKPPVIFIDIMSRPADFNELEYMSLLRERLIENGFNEKLFVVRGSFMNRIKVWWNGNPNATITFRPFQASDSRMAHQSGGMVAGFAEYYSNKAVVYPGLSPLSINRKRIFPIHMYVGVSIHELGHAIFGFRHTIDGIMQTPIIDPNLNFLPWQQDIIRTSIWGQ